MEICYLLVRPLLTTNRNIFLEKCFFGALTWFYARTESWAGLMPWKDLLSTHRGGPRIFSRSSVAAVLILVKQEFCLIQIENGQI